MFQNLGVRDGVATGMRSALVLGTMSVKIKERRHKRRRIRLPTWLGTFADGRQKATERELFWLGGFFACEDTNFDFGRFS